MIQADESLWLLQGVSIFLFILGLLLRVVGGFAWGCQDMEWWKAFGSWAVHSGVTTIYGAPDHQIKAMRKQGRTRDEILARAQNVFSFEAHDYPRTQYFLPHLPLFLYPIFLTSKLYSFYDTTLRNTRTFNFFTNLQPTFFATLTTATIYFFLCTFVDQTTALSGALLYWLSPLVLLNSPLQGFLDQAVCFTSTLALVFLYTGNIIPAYITLAFGMQHKALAILISPIIFMIGITEHSLQENIFAWLFFTLAFVVVFVPYIKSKRTLSVLLGISSIGHSTVYVSAQALNFWWPLSYFLTTEDAQMRGVERRNAIRGGPNSNWEGAVLVSHLTQRIGFNIKYIGLGLLVLFTLTNMYCLPMAIEQNRMNLFIAGFLQIYAFFMLRVSMQNNHYFTLVPVLTICATFSPLWFCYFLILSTIFFCQDLIFYGLGRDSNEVKSYLTRRNLGWLSLVVAFCNMGIFISITYYYFSSIF